MRSGQSRRWTRCVPVALSMVAGLSVVGCGASPDEAAVGGVDNDQPRGLLLNTPAARPGYGMGQIQELLQLLDGPSIVCGDFNCESSDPIVQRCLQAGLSDAFLGVAPNQTFVKQGQGRRIDFVLYSYGLTVSARPMAALTPGQYLPSETEPSDHLPLVVEVQGF